LTAVARVFDSTKAEADKRAPVTVVTPESSRALGAGAMLLRYLIENAPRKPPTAETPALAQATEMLSR
jgi:hypothetical protein